MRRTHFLATGLVALVSCSSGSPRPPTPDPWAGDLGVAAITDVNPDPHVVEFDLEAAPAEWQIAPGQTVHAMALNGSVPGPLIEANVGDTVIVHFVNHLAEPTSIHWHGVRVPADMDGSPASQAPVVPGGTFDYQFQVLDRGTFWYHSHYDEPVQMEAGMYGPIVVHGDGEPTVDHEGVVMLDDLTLGADGQIAPPAGILEDHTGREGPISLLNGRTNVQIPMRAGESQRWRIVNAGSARFYRLSIAGHTFTVLGTDGGFIEQPYTTDELFMVPGDRLDVVVTASAAPGTSVTLQNLPYDRGHGGGVFTTMDLATLQYTADPALPVPGLPSSLRHIDPIAIDGATPRTIAFDEQVDPMTGESTFLINGASYPNVPTFDTQVGVTEVWDLVNKTEMDHPFHLHGFPFQPVTLNGAPVALTSWEDTINLHAKDTLRIAFTPDDRPGMWMYHCHILEHAAHGMMADFQVNP